MKINDLEKLTGIKRSNIFYYEREGLLAPRREDNNYRDYTEDDLRRLKTIVVFRKLGFTVAEIGDLLDGRRALSDVLPENMERLTKQAEELAAASAMCRTMERRGITMESLDADEWFEALESEERQGKRFFDILGDTADDVTKTIAFVQESVGMYGPVYAQYFLSPEGIRKRRLWKWYWIGVLLSCLRFVVRPYILPWYTFRPAYPWAAVAFFLLNGITGSLVLLFCARHIIPNKKPKQAFWITFVCTVGTSLLLTFAAQPALQTVPYSPEPDRYSTEAVEEPLAYVQEYYTGRQVELAVWETGDRTFVFSSDGGRFVFKQSDDGTWRRQWDTSATVTDGVLYTADPRGPNPYPSRLMLADGTVMEPVYEAHFTTGYIPLFAFDLSDGGTYRGILFGTDANGGLHYELRASYAIQPAGAEANYTDQFRWFRASSLVNTADGAAYLSVLRNWRASIWEQNPTTSVSFASTGLNSAYLFAVRYEAPYSLVVQGDKPDWGIVEYYEVVYPLDGGARYVWIKNCGADITALLYADTVTPELLRQAAASALSDAESGKSDENMFSSRQAYTETRIWDDTVLPERLYILAQSVRAELGA